MGWLHTFCTFCMCDPAVLLLFSILTNQFVAFIGFSDFIACLRKTIDWAYFLSGLADNGDITKPVIIEIEPKNIKYFVSRALESKWGLLTISTQTLVSKICRGLSTFTLKYSSWDYLNGKKWKKNTQQFVLPFLLSHNCFDHTIVYVFSILLSRFLFVQARCCTVVVAVFRFISKGSSSRTRVLICVANLPWKYTFIRKTPKMKWLQNSNNQNHRIMISARHLSASAIALIFSWK